jgi:hypothetical protein
MELPVALARPSSEQQLGPVWRMVTGVLWVLFQLAIAFIVFVCVFVLFSG